MDLAAEPAPFLRLPADHGITEIFSEPPKLQKLRHVIAGHRRIGPIADREAVYADLEIMALPPFAAVVNDAERVGFARHNLGEAFDCIAGRFVSFRRLRPAEFEVVR